MKNKIKPRVVFFKFRNDSNVSNVCSFFLQDNIRCLSEFFEVIVINNDCDYQQVCELYQPDLALFESGNNHQACHKIDIRNARNCPEIPKLGIHHGDSWCEARAGFLSDMDLWGIETFFSVSTTIAELTPAMSENVFVWPNFIDPSMCRDYGESKIIPVMFSGYLNPLYPWREKMSKIISQYYPSLICPHPGYVINSDSTHEVYAIYGEHYARTINASWFVPTCGTVANEILRKHFEIPGSRSCLITEKTPIVEAAGFIDMQNCIFADDTNILDKLDYLFNNLDELNKIIDAGYKLVHSRHTLKHRDQIFQWFNLQKNLKANQRIIQTDPFKPLCIVERSSGIKSNHTNCDGLILQILRKGDEALWSGEYKKAEVLYRQAHEHILWMPEPKLRLALCSLYSGNSAAAFSWVLSPIKYTLEKYQAIDPDPVEWAYLIVVLLCKGKLDDAAKCADLFLYLSHPQLNRVRWVVNILKNTRDKDAIVNSESMKHRHSVHQLPDLSIDEWLDRICIMLAACKQFRFAIILRKTTSLEREISAKCFISKNKKYLLASSPEFKQEEVFSQSYKAISLISEISESERANPIRRIKQELKTTIKKDIITPFRYYLEKL